MLQHTKTGEELIDLATRSEDHLRAEGHAVKAVTDQALTVFELRPDDSDEMLCRVQAVGHETFEIARARGETLSGIGGEAAFFLMLERVVTEQEQKAA